MSRTRQLARDGIHELTWLVLAREDREIAGSRIVANPAQLILSLPGTGYAGRGSGSFGPGTGSTLVMTKATATATTTSGVTNAPSGAHQYHGE
jgi:hypothetical protein